MPAAQIVVFTKVFIEEIVEKGDSPPFRDILVALW